MKQFALEPTEIGDVIASSPGPSPAMCASRWRPAVPLETAATYGAPMRSASSSSKRSIVGPSESRPERSTSRTSSSSRSSNSGRASGISRTDVPGRPPPTAGGARLVGEVEVRADQRLLVHAVAEILRDLDHGVARDSRQDRGREIGREELAVLDEEDVLARAVGDEPVAGQQDRLVVAGAVRLGHG